jgi:hypothetical protein
MYAVIYLYDFTNPAGTVSYEQRGVSILTTDPASKTTPTAPLPGIPGAIGITGTTQSRALDAVIYTKGNYLVRVAMQGPSATYAMAASGRGSVRAPAPSESPESGARDAVPVAKQADGLELTPTSALRAWHWHELKRHRRVSTHGNPHRVGSEVKSLNRRLERPLPARGQPPASCLRKGPVPLPATPAEWG